MKILATAGVVLLSSMLLVACGGDSDSSGDDHYTDSSHTDSNNTDNNEPDSVLTNLATENACEINTQTNEVYATYDGCDFAHPTLQNGTALTYTCVADNRVNGVQGGLNITAATINLAVGNDKVTVLCPPSQS